MEKNTAVMDRGAVRDDRIAPKARDEIDALTGVRGAAAVIVIAYHTYPAADFPYGISHLVARGYLAVDVFFVLSGFVMALTYGRMFRDRVALPAFFTFLMRRVARLYPLYIIFLALRIAYSLAVYGSLQVPNGWFAMNLPMPVKDVIANIFMIQSWGVAKAVTTPPGRSAPNGAPTSSFPSSSAVCCSAARATPSCLCWPPRR